MPGGDVERRKRQRARRAASGRPDVARSASGTPPVVAGYAPPETPPETPRRPSGTLHAPVPFTPPRRSRSATHPDAPLSPLAPAFVPAGVRSLPSHLHNLPQPRFGAPIGPGTPFGSYPGIPWTGTLPGLPPQLAAWSHPRAPPRVAPIRPNPRNDYAAHYVHTGERPQNFIRDGQATIDERFAPFPTRRELVRLKRAHVERHAAPPATIRCDLRRFELAPRAFGGVKFDVVLLDPPWDFLGADPEDAWTPDEIRALPLESIAGPLGVILFPVVRLGRGRGSRARPRVPRQVGIPPKREICWIKTNCGDPDPSPRPTQTPSSPAKHPPLVSVKEHCLVGIQGSIRRGVDGHIMHANVDTDIVVAPDRGRKPAELYDIIENFAQGRRRLELFGNDGGARRGWLTVGPKVSRTDFHPEAFAAQFSRGRHLLPRHPRVEELRPKTPPHSRSGTTRP